MLLSVDLNAAQVSKYPTGYAGMDIDIRKININEVYHLENSRLFRINKYNERYNYVIYINKFRSAINSLIKYKIKEMLGKIGLYSGIIRELIIIRLL